LSFPLIEGFYSDAVVGKYYLSRRRGCMRVSILTPQMLRVLFGIFRVKVGWFKYEWVQDCPLRECIAEAKRSGLDIFTFLAEIS